MSVIAARTFCQSMETDPPLMRAVTELLTTNPPDRLEQIVALGVARGFEFSPGELGEVLEAAGHDGDGVTGGRLPARLNVTRKEFPKSVLQSSVWPAPNW
jgi:hypothetical protein